MKRSAVIAAVLMSVVAAVLVSAGLTGSASAAPHKYTFTVVSHDAQGNRHARDFFATPPVQNAQASVDAPVSRIGTTVGLEIVMTITRVSGEDVAAMIECSVELPGASCSSTAPPISPSWEREPRCLWSAAPASTPARRAWSPWWRQQTGRPPT